jgi:hypothetical protein
VKITEYVRGMDKRLRISLIVTALLGIPLTGQSVSVSDIKHTGHLGDLALFFTFAAIFIVPTALILTVAVLSTIRNNLLHHRLLVFLGVLNILVALDITWYFIHL